MGEGPIIGIDLGTTFSSIAFLNAFGRAEVIPTTLGARSIPSVVLFPPGEEGVVGKRAKELSAEYPERVVEFVKREMGDPDWFFDVDGREVRPQTISALILRRLLEMAEGALGHRPESAVITCPAYFGDLERQATAEAGRLAGIEVLSVFNEPTAAALAYGLHNSAGDEPVRAMVYDLGGGTFDVTVLELKGRRVEVLATAGEHRLGGKDWDDELLNFVAEEFQVEFDLDPRDDPGAMQDLRNRCEAAKVVLSKKNKVTIFCRAYGKTLKLPLPRGLFEELTRPLLLQTQTYLEQVLQFAGVGWDAIDVVLPVGGSSHMPQVRRLLKEQSGREPETSLDPDLAVVQGAAYYAALARAEQGFSVKVFATRQPTGRLAKRGRSESDELPMLPPAPPPTMDEAPELLGLPGEVAAPHAVFAIPMLPGAIGKSERPSAKLKPKPRPSGRPSGRPKPRPSGRPSGRPNPKPKSRPKPKPRPKPQPVVGALPPSSAELPALPPAPSDALQNLAMGIALERPVDANATVVYDFADLVSLSDVDVSTPARAVVNVNARSLGVLVHKAGEARTSVMVPANTQLPATKRSTFYTINDNQTGVRVVVLEGESPDPDECTRIGECVISGLPARAKGQEIEISYSYDSDGRIRIESRDVGTGKAARVELKRPSSLSERELADEAAWMREVMGY
jgi:molecular chaperone DnaK (HSP70)